MGYEYRYRYGNCCWRCPNIGASSITKLKATPKPKRSPKSSPPELKPKSSPPEMNQPKRLPTSLPSDLDPSSPAKKSKTNGSDQENGSDLESSLAELGWTPEDLLLTPEERAEKAWTAYFAKRDPSLSKAFRKVELLESLPEGCAWGSYVPGSGQKKFVYVITCYNCGVGGAHLTDDCPDKDTDEAKEFRRESLTLRVPSSGHETKPENN